MTNRCLRIVPLVPINGTFTIVPIFETNSIYGEADVVKRAAATLGTMGLFAAVTVVATQPPERGMTTYPVSFPSGSTALHQNDMETLRGVAAMMKRDPSLIATVIGKADTVGPAEFNEHLSQQRAEKVFGVLIHAYKVPADRVQMSWAGEWSPVVPTGQQVPELQNRVVEVVLR